MHGIPVSQDTVKHILLHGCMCTARILNLFSCYSLQTLASLYSKTCLKRNLKGPEHFSAKASFPFNQGTLPV